MTKFNFKKKFGQNFLNDKNIIEKIVDSINPTPDDLIIEIGPGSGALTKELKKYRANLLAFEIDTDTKEYLLPLEDEKTKIIYEDFLTANLPEILTNIKYNKLYIIGNLPYYITTPILEKIIDSNIEPESVTVMVQKEVAERFLAIPGTRDYGYMTVLLNYSFDISKICNVPNTAFYPQPKVDSTVIKLTKQNSKPLDYQKFKNLLKNSFQFKRKTIFNNLKNYPKEELENILNKHNYNLSTRAEAIDLDTFIDLTNNLNK